MRWIALPRRNAAAFHRFLRRAGETPAWSDGHDGATVTLPARIVVFGGRDYADRDRVFAVLDRIRAERGVACVVHGAASGVDTLAGEWARDRGVPEHPEPADWTTYGRKAGPLRNQRILDTYLLDGAVAFPGGKGTADMADRCRRAGIPVYEPA